MRVHEGQVTNKTGCVPTTAIRLAHSITNMLVRSERNVLFSLEGKSNKLPCPSLNA